MQIEFVKDKVSKEPFSASDKVSAKIHALGLKPEHGICFLAANGTLPGNKGDYIGIAPPFNVTEEEVQSIVERTEKVIRTYFEQRDESESR